MSRKTILVVDTQVEGHHILWLYLVANSLYELGYNVIMLVNNDISEVSRRLSLLDVTFSNKVTMLPSRYAKKPPLNAYWQELVISFNKYSCNEILFNNFDTIASNVFRKAAFGLLPPKILRGKISAIYHRPRPLDPSQQGFSNLWKSYGCNVIIKSGFIKHFWLLDPDVVTSVHHKGNISCSFIPDPWYISCKSVQPKEIVNVDRQKIHLLQYGVGDKRKGTLLLLKALSNTRNNQVHVWLAGKQVDDEVLTLAQPLVEKGVLTLIDRYVTEPEERWLFENCTWVTLPYLSHYGSSNLLSKAAKFVKPVIASDFHLIGRNVANYNLGICFQDQSIDSLTSILDNLSNIKIEQFAVSLDKFADKYSLNNFRNALAVNFPRY